MKILMFDYEYPPLGGGGGVVHRHIAEELAKRHDVAVVTSGHKDLAERETVGGVDVHRVKVVGRHSLSTASLPSMLTYYLASLRSGQALIDTMKPDLINTHFAVPTGPSAVKLARRNGLPHALCIHGGDIFDPSKALSPHRIPGLRHTVRWVLRHVDRIVAQSRNTRDNARRYYGITGDIDIIPHGLKRPAFGPVARSELGLSDDQIVLITVGRLVKRKANHELVELFARIDDRRARLVIVGAGPEQERIADAAARHGVADRVILTGFVSEERKVQLMLAADMFVSTTQHEGFGLMFIEGMFCGLPIITYDHGGQVDIVEDGKSGFLIPLGDDEAFVEKLEGLVRDATRRAEMGRIANEDSGRYVVEVCAAQYETVFDEMLGQGVRR